MTEHDARTLPAALVAIITCGWAAHTERWLVAVGVLGVAALLGVIGARWGRWPHHARRACALLATACVLAGVIAGIGALRQALALPPEVTAAVERGEQVHVRGIAVAEARPLSRDAWSGAERVAIRLRVDSACAEPCASPRRARAVIDVVTAGWVPALGDEVDATGVARPSRDPRVAAVLWSSEVTPTTRHDPALHAIGIARERTRAQASTLHPDVRDLTLGMVLGDTRGMSADLTADMRVTSLTHLTAVSGSHFAIVTMTLGFVLRIAVRRRWVRALLLAVAMATLTLYVGPDPSVQRALTMALAMAVGMWWGRPSHALPALGVGVLTLLAIEPALGASIGLQLSAVAVLAIVVWAPHVRDILARRFMRPAATAIAVPLCAWLACWPLLVTVNPGFGPYAVPANLVGGIAAFPVTIIGLLGAVIGQLWPAGGSTVLEVASWCAWPVVWAARAFAAAPGAWLSWPHGIAGSVLAGLVAGLVAVGTMVRRMALAWRTGAVIAGVVVSLASPMLTAQVNAGAADAAIVVCDVGQGDMTLLVAGDGAAIVVDTGPSGGAGVECLRRYGVTTVPLLILSHPHADHDGALSELLAVVSVAHVWVSPAALEADHDAAARAASAQGIPVTVAHIGDTAEHGAVRVTVVGPDGGHRSPTDSAHLNDGSVVVLATAQGASALLLGDLETAGQDALAARLGGPVVVDLVKVAHHGSRAQSERLAGAVTARIAAVSVGEDNSYGHPHPDALALYRHRATYVLATSTCGDIVVTSTAGVAARCLSSMAG